VTFAQQLYDLRIELASIRAEIRDKLDHLESLQTVNAAKEAYGLCLADVKKRLTEAIERKSEKENLKRKAKLDIPEIAPPPIGIPKLHPRRPGEHYRPRRNELPNRNPELDSGTNRRTISSPAGQRFKELVERWYGYWRLPRAVLSQINRIADDLDGSPGEALMLLDEKLYNTPALPEETEEEQLERLTEWHEMLIDYRDQLMGKIDSEEIHYGSLLSIWQSWCARDENDAWETLIANSIQDVESEIGQIEREIAELEIEIAGLGDGGGKL